MQARADQIVSLVKDSFGQCNAEFAFVGSNELLGLTRKIPTYSLELPFVEVLAKGERYVLLANIEDYAAFVSDSGKLRRYLFDSNVRDFMGLNSVNEDIKTTLEADSSSDFWWLNNGVTILATSASVVGKSMQMTDIQIVNGLQTTESIFRYFRKGGLDEQRRSVLVKIIVTNDEVVRDSIIRATNNQSTVEKASLHATDKIQRDIEDILRRNGLYYERRTNYYANLGRKHVEIIAPLLIAAGYVSLILKLPYKAANLRARFMRHENAYDLVFSNEAPLEVWPKIAFILKRTDQVLEQLRPFSKGQDKFLKSWRHIVSFLTVSLLMKKFDFVSKELVTFDITSMTDELIETVWNQLNQVEPLILSSKKWIGRQKVLDVCELFANKYQISGLRMIRSKSPAILSGAEGTSNIRGELLPDFIEKVFDALPPQPWKPGIHKDVVANLGCTTREYFDAVNSLIEDGRLYQQKDGVLYDPEGNIVTIDLERVDPNTLELLPEIKF